MTKVITYGTFDLLHYGHINLLKRAKELGDYLIVGVTAEAYDMAREKINVTQSLAERIENVRETGIADEIIVEEYEGQKIDDVKRYFYQLEGEGFYYELITFVQAVSTGRENSYIAQDISSALCQIMGDYYNSPNTLRID